LRLVREVLFVVVGLDFEMLTAVGWLRGRNVAVRVLKYWTFRIKLPLKVSKKEKVKCCLQVPVL